MEIWEPKPPGTLWVTQSLVWDCFNFFLSFSNILTETQASLHAVRSETPLYVIYHFSLPVCGEQTRLNA